MEGNKTTWLVGWVGGAKMNKLILCHVLDRKRNYPMKNVRHCHVLGRCSTQMLVERSGDVVNNRIFHCHVPSEVRGLLGG